MLLTNLTFYFKFSQINLSCLYFNSYLPHTRTSHTFISFIFIVYHFRIDLFAIGIFRKFLRKSIQTHTYTTHSQCNSSGTASSSPIACIQKDATKSTDDENNSAETVHIQSTPESLSSPSDICVTSNAITYRYRTKVKTDHAKYESKIH